MLLEVWSLVGFQLFMSKQSILAGYSLLALEKLNKHNLDQELNWEHPQGKENFSRRKFCFYHTDTCDMIDLGKEKVFTLTEVVAAIKGLKSIKLLVKTKSDLKC